MVSILLYRMPQIFQSERCNATISKDVPFRNLCHASKSRLLPEPSYIVNVPVTTAFKSKGQGY